MRLYDYYFEYLAPLMAIIAKIGALSIHGSIYSCLHMYVCMYTALITHQYVVRMGWKKLHLHESSVQTYIQYKLTLQKNLHSVYNRRIYPLLSVYRPMFYGDLWLGIEWLGIEFLVLFQSFASSVSLEKI